MANDTTWRIAVHDRGTQLGWLKSTIYTGARHAASTTNSGLAAQFANEGAAIKRIDAVKDQFPGMSLQQVGVHL